MTARLPDGRIRIPARLEGDGITGDGMAVISPGDPQYAAYDEYLKAQESGGDQPWAVTGAIPDSGDRVTLAWDGGLQDWPPDALDWALAAAAEGLVQLDDGPRLLAWLQTQGFTQATP